MTLAARFAAIIGVLGFLGLGFFAFVSYQGAHSVAIVEQTSLLDALGKAAPVAVGDQLISVDLDDGQARALDGTLPEGILDQIAENRPVHKSWAEADGLRYIWTYRQRAEKRGRRALVYVSEIASPDPFLRYMMVPLWIAAVIVIWGSVWAGIAIARMIRRLEQQRALEVSLAEETENRRYRDSFLAHLSHELRTPLNAIVGFSQVLASGTFGPLGNAKYAEYAENIHRSGLHLVRLVGNILDHSRIALVDDTLHETDFDIAAAVSEVASILSEQAEHGGVRVSLAVEPSLPQLKADRTRTVQVLLNLLSNAIKFTAPGGSVEVSATIGPDRELEVRFADTGIGISAQDLEIVQKPFGRAGKNPHLSKDGTGLGLSLSTSLMQLQGGDLRLESEPGVGTVATAIFPAERCNRLRLVS